MTKKRILIVTIALLALLLIPFFGSKVASSRVQADAESMHEVIKPLQTPTEMILAEFIDAPIMLEVARAESTLCTDNYNRSVPRSSAKGCFAILDSTWKDAQCTGDVINPADNIACARILYNQSKLRPWEASRHVWGKYLVDKK